MADEPEPDANATTSNVILPQLQDKEQTFFELVEAGNVTDVREFLANNAGFNVNATDFQGVTALHLAVRDRNIPMIVCLLSHRDIDPMDTHLHAVRDNQVKIATLIMNRLNEITAGMEFAGVLHSVEFPDNASPMAIAASYGHYEMINHLRKRNHSLPRPHPPDCNCEPCKRNREKYDLLAIKKMRLFLYTAISNPVYICQTVDDPILEAFQLSYELDNAGAIDREFFHDYKQLSEAASQFAADLIGCARRIDEVELILNRSTGFAQSTKFVYPRLLFALHYKQRGFVAHPNVQQLVENKWVEDWYEWKIMKQWKKCFHVFARVPVVPFMPFILFLAPNSRFAKFLQSPVNKFLSSSASYLVFLLFVFLQSNVDKTDQLRGPPHTAYVWILILYVISFIWAICRLGIIHGPKRFFGVLRYWYDLVMIALFTLTFLFWIAAAVDVRLNGQLDLERKYWHMYDPTLVAEGIYCLAAIMAYFRLMFICQLDYHLGPLQISLGKMVADVVKFIVIFTIIMLAFSVGLNKLYQYYDEMVQIDDESSIKTQQVSSFVGFVPSLKTLFWAIFCMSPIESADVVIENLPGESETETIINHHSFTEVIGYISFAVYHFISVIVLLNMLIACMSNTFTKVTENVIVEWTFGRTEAYIDFMLMTTLPPPFNVLPTYAGIRAVAEYVKILLKPPADKRARFNLKHCFFTETLHKDQDAQFGVTMAQLVQRYLHNKCKESEDSEAERLRQEVVELRNLLRDALSSS